MAAWFPYDVHILIASLLALLWYHVRDIYKKYKVAGVPHLAPTVPFGNTTKSMFRIQHVVDDINDAYNKFPDHRYVGFYQMNLPVLLLRDPETIKQITVKDFDYFLDHRAFVNEETDPLFGKNLFSMKGNKWRDMRSTLSPAFTGSKMKNMCSLMSDCGQQVNEYLMDMITKGKHPGASLTVDLKDLCTRFTSDVIATTAFGIKVDSLHDKENQFFTIGKKSTNFDGLVLFKFFGFLIVPKLMALLGIRLFNDETCDFYRGLVQDTMKHREAQSIYRPDMIQLLMDAKKGTLKHEEQANGGKAGFATVEESNINIGNAKRKWEDDDLTAQAILFLLAGFETAANLMCFVLYELAVNPTIQERLQDEIDSLAKANGDSLTYETIQKLTYLDMIVSETLRKWPPSVITDRVCGKEYDIGLNKEGDETTYKVSTGDILWLPIYSIHRDPNYWPNPDEFDPERFSDENKGNIQPYTFLPFGAGPRNCIGSRFALMEVKVLVYRLISKFNVRMNSKTKVPLQLARNTFNLKAGGGFWADLQPRK